MEGNYLRMLLVVTFAVVAIGTVSATGREPHASDQHALSVPQYETDHWWEFWKHHHHHDISNKTVAFVKCYGKCFLLCNIPMPMPGICAGKCVLDCAIFRPHISEAHNFCNLGCATSKCTNISTLTNPHAAEVETCVNSCSNDCDPKHLMMMKP